MDFVTVASVANLSVMDLSLFLVPEVAEAKYQVCALLALELRLPECFLPSANVSSHAFLQCLWLLHCEF